MTLNTMMTIMQPPRPAANTSQVKRRSHSLLERAGLARNQVTNLKAEFETEHGIALYEVEFDANGYEYEIKVNAADGSIMKFDRDYDDDHDDHNHGGHHENPTAAPTQTPSESYIGTERAKQIAISPCRCFRKPG